MKKDKSPYSETFRHEMETYLVSEMKPYEKTKFLNNEK